MQYIIKNKTAGLIQDAEIYKKYLGGEIYESGPAARVRIYIESITPELLYEPGVNILLANYEFFLYRDEEKYLDKITLVLAKNVISYEYYLALKADKKYNYTPVLMGHTSFVKDKKPIDKDYSSYLHIAGTSPYKQTEAVVAAWVANPDLPLLILVAKPQVFAILKKYLRDYGVSEATEAKIKSGEIKNIEYHEYVSDICLMQQRVFHHIVPSVIEGFGHVLNEARAYSAFLITSDYEPMNEMSDCVIKCDKMYVRGKPSNVEIKNCIINPESVAKKVREVIKMSKEDKIASAEAGYKNYMRDKAKFERNMQMLKYILSKY